MKTAAILFSAIFACAGATAQAATVTETAPIRLPTVTGVDEAIGFPIDPAAEVTIGSRSLSVSNFDTSLGTLTSVNIDFRYGFSFAGVIEPRAAGSDPIAFGTAQTDAIAEIFVTRPETNTSTRLIQVITPRASFACDESFRNGLAPCTDPANGGGLFTLRTDNASGVASTVLSAQEWTDAVGDGDIFGFGARLNVLPNLLNGEQFRGSVSTARTTGATFTYNFDPAPPPPPPPAPVPLPAGLPLVLTAIGLLFFVGHRRQRL